MTGMRLNMNVLYQQKEVIVLFESDNSITQMTKVLRRLYSRK